MPDAPRVLITAGPTHEPIDAVRYLGNRSSGRMGLAITRACLAAGCPTTLLLGPTAHPPPQTSHLLVHRFRTTAELESLLRETWPEHDLLIMAAAVADYRPKAVSDEKLRRSGDGLTLELEATPDLLAGLGPLTRPDQRVVGFALEPADELETRATGKLERKGLDAIVANPLETMDAETVTGTLLWRDGRAEQAPPRINKQMFGEWLVSRLLGTFSR